jgi:hypothetical protein
MSRHSDEQGLLDVVTSSLKSWLSKVKDAVMRPWRTYQGQPDPTAVYQVDWEPEIDTILTELGKISLRAWSQASDVPPVSRHAFVMSQLAQTRNFLVRMPDETADLIFAEMTDAINAGDDTSQVAARVDRILTWTGSEYWPHRARVIAITETTRAYGAGTLAAGMEQSRVTGKLLQKRWRDEADSRVRATHRAVNGQTLPLTGLFQVGLDMMLYPGDPLASVDEVAGCRCDLEIVDGG